MLRDVIDIIDFLDNASNSAEAFTDFLPDGPHSVEITPFKSDLGECLARCCVAVANPRRRGGKSARPC